MLISTTTVCAVYKSIIKPCTKCEALKVKNLYLNTLFKARVSHYYYYYLIKCSKARI